MARPPSEVASRASTVQAAALCVFTHLAPHQARLPSRPAGHRTVPTAGTDVTGRALSGVPSRLPPQRPSGPGLSKRHWQEPGKATPLFQLAERMGGEMGSGLQVIHAPLPPPPTLTLNPHLRKCKAEPQTSHPPQARCPLVCTHTCGVQRHPGKRWPRARSCRVRCFVPGRGVCIPL